MSDAATLLAEVDSAIRAVLLGQSYALNGRSLTRANLGELRALRKELQVEVGQADGTRPMFTRGVPTGLR